MTSELDEIKVASLANKQPPTVNVDMPLSKAADKMLREKAHRVIVTDKSGKPLGIVSSWDVVKVSFISDQAKNISVSKLIEGQKLIFVFDEVSVRDALNLMVDKKIRSLPVMNFDEELVGLISLFDIAKFVREKL